MNHSYPIIGKKTILRPVEPEDIDFIQKWENDPEFWSVSSHSGPLSISEIEDFISSSDDLSTQNQIRWIIFDMHETAIGAIDIFDYHVKTRTAGIGILIADRTDRRQGFAHDALSSLIEFYRKEKTITTFRCLIFTDNYGSLKLFQNNGFKEISVTTFKNKQAMQFIRIV
jgi:diamine N-acetyltransferase